MPTTTNYGWTTPADTDLVKDGASAIRTLGTAIDTTVFNNAGAAIAKTIVDAKGDIIAATAADTVSRLAVGANDTVLTADSSTATGLKWATPTSGANWTLLNSGGTALTGAQTVTISSVPSGTDKIMVLIGSASSASASSYIQVRLNADTGSNYYTFTGQVEVFSAYQTNYLSHDNGSARGGMRVGLMGNSATNQVSGMVIITGCNASGVKSWTSLGAADGVGATGFWGGGYYDSSSVISSVSVNSSTGNLDNGTVYVYTSA